MDSKAILLFDSLVHKICAYEFKNIVENDIYKKVSVDGLLETIIMYQRSYSSKFCAPRNFSDYDRIRADPFRNKPHSLHLEYELLAGQEISDLTLLVDFERITEGYDYGIVDLRMM
jgi:hypothetical protein